MSAKRVIGWVRYKMGWMTNVRSKVLGWRSHPLVGKTLEDIGDNLVQGLLVMGLQPVLVLSVQFFLRDVEIQRHLIIALELHNDERVSGLTLAQRGVEANAQQEMHLIWLGKYHKLLDGIVLDLVIVSLTTKSE